MAFPREQMVDDVRRYIEAGERLVVGINEFITMNSEALQDIEAGMSLTESFSNRDSAAWSRRVSSLLDEFEARRRDTRRSAAAALLEEGRSVTEVGRAFGVSHQLASRFVKSQPVDPGEGALDVAD
jgi:methylmalonyl-CoA mutase N-terminal domain/subunit